MIAGATEPCPTGQTPNGAAAQHIQGRRAVSYREVVKPLDESRFSVSQVFVVDACRTPVGKVKGSLAEVRPDHLAAGILKALLTRNPAVDPNAIDDVYWGAANQAGEDNRNVARMAVLLAGLPKAASFAMSRLFRAEAMLTMFWQ